MDALVISSPVDSRTTGGPAVKIAPVALMIRKSHTGATSAPCPADGPRTAPSGDRVDSGSSRKTQELRLGTRLFKV